MFLQKTCLSYILSFFFFIFLFRFQYNNFLPFKGTLCSYGPMIQIFSVPPTNVSCVFLGIFIEFSFIVELTFKTDTFLLSFLLWFLYGTASWYEKKKEKNPYSQESFYSAIKTKKNFKKNPHNCQQICFCYYFSAILLCALMLWTSKHLPWLLYIFFTCFSISLILFFFSSSSILVFASVMVFDLFLKRRADWLSIFLSWRCVSSSMKHSGSTHF